MTATYLQALALKFPNVQVTSPGEGAEYELLEWLGGDPLPSKSVLDIAKRDVDRERIWREIQAIRDSRKSSGVKIGSHWFHSDDTSRIQHIGLVMMGANLTGNLMWKTLGGDFVLMTVTLAQQIFMLIAANDQRIFAKAEQHRAEMMKSPNPNLYDYTGGWPPIFGE